MQRRGELWLGSLEPTHTHTHTHTLPPPPTHQDESFQGQADGTAAASSTGYGSGSGVGGWFLWLVVSLLKVVGVGSIVAGAYYVYTKKIKPQNMKTF